MKVRARFKGMPNFGYSNGYEYTLRFTSGTVGADDYVNIQEIVSESYGGAITRLRSESFCEYSSLRKFLDNWEVL